MPSFSSPPPRLVQTGKAPKGGEFSGGWENRGRPAPPNQPAPISGERGTASISKNRGGRVREGARTSPISPEFLDSGFGWVWETGGGDKNCWGGQAGSPEKPWGGKALQFRGLWKPEERGGGPKKVGPAQGRGVCRGQGTPRRKTWGGDQKPKIERAARWRGGPGQNRGGGDAKRGTTGKQRRERGAGRGTGFAAKPTARPSGGGGGKRGPGAEAWGWGGRPKKNGDGEKSNAPGSLGDKTRWGGEAGSAGPGARPGPAQGELVGGVDVWVTTPGRKGAGRPRGHAGGPNQQCGRGPFWCMGGKNKGAPSWWAKGQTPGPKKKRRAGQWGSCAASWAPGRVLATAARWGGGRNGKKRDPPPNRLVGEGGKGAKGGCGGGKGPRP